MVSIFKGKGDIRNCSCYGAVRLLENRMKVMEISLEKWLCRVVSDNEMQFCFMPERGIIDAVFILSGLQEEYNAKGKNCTCVLRT